MTLRVALTGGIGSGKSAVSGRFAALGTPIVDTDVIARQLVRPGAPGHQAIEAAWGRRFFDENGQLQRRALRAAMLADPALKRELEALLHPLIREHLQEQIAIIDAPYAIIVVPLLLEAGFEDLADRVLWVDCDRETRIQRVMRRDRLPREAIEAIIATQAPETALRRIADDIIDNRGTEAALDPQTSALHRNYLALAQGNRA